MAGDDEDDKPTVVLDLNALKKQKLKQEEELANIASELEFNVSSEKMGPPQARRQIRKKVKVPDDLDSEDFTEKFLGERKLETGQPKIQPKKSFTVVLFDFQSDFFQKSIDKFPKGFDYKVIKELAELNACLRSKNFQIVVFNYDVNPKAVNQLSAQIKQKLPTTKTVIMAKSISLEKAKVHAATTSGATGYYQFPLETSKIEKEFLKIYSKDKKVG